MMKISHSLEARNGGWQRAQSTVPVWDRAAPAGTQRPGHEWVSSSGLARRALDRHQGGKAPIRSPAVGRSRLAHQIFTRLLRRRRRIWRLAARGWSSRATGCLVQEVFGDGGCKEAEDAGTKPAAMAARVDSDGVLVGRSKS